MGSVGSRAAGAVRALPRTLGPVFPVEQLGGARPQAATQAPRCLKAVLGDLCEHPAGGYVTSGVPVPSLASVPSCGLRLPRTLQFWTHVFHTLGSLGHKNNSPVVGPCYAPGRFQVLGIRYSSNLHGDHFHTR